MVLFSGLLLAAAAAAAPSKAPAVLAVVNGVPIKKAEMLDRTWKQYGLSVVNEAIDDVLTRQAAMALGVKADAREVELRLRGLQGQAGDDAASRARLADLRAEIEEQVLRESLVAKAKGLAVTDAEVQAFFDANKERLGAPESVHLRQLVVASEREAADFLIAFKAGADFAKLAAQVSLDRTSKERGGDVGFIARSLLSPDIEKAVYALRPGELAGPVRTALGFHVLKVEEFKPAKPAVFAELQNDLRKGLLVEKINKAWPDYIQELRSKAKIEKGSGWNF